MSTYQPAPGQPMPQAEDPGRTLGIVGLILAFVAAAVGMIISIVAFRKSKAAGYKNNLALAGIIVGAVITLVYVVGGIALGVAASSVLKECQQLGPGVHQINGTAVTCS